MKIVSRVNIECDTTLVVAPDPMKHSGRRGHLQSGEDFHFRFGRNARSDEIESGFGDGRSGDVTMFYLLEQLFVNERYSEFFGDHEKRYWLPRANYPKSAFRS